MLCNRSVSQMSDVYTVCAFSVPKANRKLPKNSCTVHNFSNVFSLEMLPLAENGYGSPL